MYGRVTEAFTGCGGRLGLNPLVSILCSRGQIERLLRKSSCGSDTLMWEVTSSVSK